jgi:lipoyl(octanoyl) transferase
MKKVVKFKDLGLISYQEAWDYQRNLHQQLVDVKLQNRALAEAAQPLIQQQNYLLFCEHPHVYTLGKTGNLEHLLLNEAELKAKEIEFFKINRGGDITYHGQGQIVGYPIFDLECFFTDVHKYVRFLEEAIIRTLAEYGIVADRIKDFTGVWILPKDGSPKRKICAIGVHLSRWITMHGFAFNVNNDLKYFDYIIPCGIQEDDKTVTSLAKELGYSLDIEEVKDKIKSHFETLFEYDKRE